MAHQYEYEQVAFTFDAKPADIATSLTELGKHGWYVVHCHDTGHAHVFYLCRLVEPE